MEGTPILNALRNMALEFLEFLRLLIESTKGTPPQ